MRIALALLLLCACESRWYGLNYELDEHPDSETGVIETYCRYPDSEPVPSNWERVREIHVLWRHATELYSNRLPEYGKVRVIYIHSPSSIAPSHTLAVPWEDWAEANGHNLDYTPRGFCVWDTETPDGMYWLYVTTYNFKQPLPILAHEMSHMLFPELNHGDEFDAVILSLLTGSIG